MSAGLCPAETLQVKNKMERKEDGLVGKVLATQA